MPNKSSFKQTWETGDDFVPRYTRKKSKGKKIKSKSNYKNIKN